MSSRQELKNYVYVRGLAGKAFSGHPLTELAMPTRGGLHDHPEKWRPCAKLLAAVLFLPVGFLAGGAYWRAGLTTDRNY